VDIKAAPFKESVSRERKDIAKENSDYFSLYLAVSPNQVILIKFKETVSRERMNIAKNNSLLYH
jgi:hypothetical protein